MPFIYLDHMFIKYTTNFILDYVFSQFTKKIFKQYSFSNNTNPNTKLCINTTEIVYFKILIYLI